jgi:hypothetical protein
MGISLPPRIRIASACLALDFRSVHAPLQTHTHTHSHSTQHTHTRRRHQARHAADFTLLRPRCRKSLPPSLPPLPPLSVRRHGGDGCGIPNLCCGRVRRGAAQERHGGLDPGAERADAAGRHAATAASVFRAVLLIDDITDGPP